MMQDWYDKMVKALQLNGKGERTQQAYARAVRMLTEFNRNSPEELTEDEFQDYFLHRKNLSKWSPITMRTCYCGIRFFYQHVLQRDWHILNILRAQTEHRLPSVRSFEEVRKLLGCVKTAQNYVFLGPTSSITLTRVATLIHLTFGFNLPPQEQPTMNPPTPCTCPRCGGFLICRASLFPLIATPQDTG
jgi:site-specific recombinase XerD